MNWRNRLYRLKPCRKSNIFYSSWMDTLFLEGCFFVSKIWRVLRLCTWFVMFPVICSISPPNFISSFHFYHNNYLYTMAVASSCASYLFNGLFKTREAPLVPTLPSSFVDVWFCHCLRTEHPSFDLHSSFHLLRRNSHRNGEAPLDRRARHEQPLFRPKSTSLVVSPTITRNGEAPLNRRGSPRAHPSPDSPLSSTTYPLDWNPLHIMICIVFVDLFDINKILARFLYNVE